MTDEIDWDTVIIHRGHGETVDNACTMDLVHARWLIAQYGSIKRALTDRPPCTEPVIARATTRVNDLLDDVQRQRLRPLIERLYVAHKANPARRKRVLVRLACWAARSVLDLAPADDREVCETAIETAEAWLDGQASRAECKSAAYAADATADAAYAVAYAADATADAAYAAYAAYAAADAAYAAYAAYAAAAAYTAAADAAADAADATATAGRDLVVWLSGLLDAYDSALQAEVTP